MIGPMKFTHGPLALRRSLLAIPMTSTITPITPVWAEKEAMYKSQMRSEDELRDFYEEELFIDDQSVDEDNAQAQQATVASIPSSGCYFATYDAHGIYVPAMDHKQQACRPYAAPRTILFDMAVPDETSKELALLALFSPEEMPALFMRPVKEIAEYLPTPELLDTCNLKLQPTRATGPLYDSISQMLNLDSCEDFKVQETVSEYATKRSGRSLMRQPPIFNDSELSELTAEEIDLTNEQVRGNNRILTRIDVAEVPRDRKVDCDCVLRQITGHTFLPGIEHMTNIEARSAFITYESDIEELRQATAEFLHDDLYVCDKVGATMLPGENLLLPENDTALSLSIQDPTAQSLLDLIDRLRNSEAFVEDTASPPNAAPQVQEFLSFDRNPRHNSYQESPRREVTPSLGAFHDAANSKCVNYTALALLTGQSSIKETVRHETFRDIASSQCPRRCNNEEISSLGLVFDPSSSQYTSCMALDQFLGCSDHMSNIVCAHSNVADDVSDTFKEGTNELFMTLPTELTYFDAEIQQPVAYTAFNQLFVYTEMEEIFPRMHRADMDIEDEFFNLVDSVLDIGELPFSGHDTELGISSPYETDSEMFDLQFGDGNLVPNQTSVTDATPRSVDSLRSYSLVQQRRSKRRPHLTVNTTLDVLFEVSSEEDKASHSSSSSESSVGFTNQRGFVRTMSARRTDFLDDEDSDGNRETPQFSNSPSSSGSTSSQSSTASPTVNHARELYFDCVLFDDPIWHSQPDLLISFPRTPLNSCTSLLADSTPGAEIVGSLEIEIVKLIAYIFKCLNSGRLVEVRVLGSDLQWALCALADTFPRFRLLEHLGTTVEILLERVAASGI